MEVLRRRIIGIMIVCSLLPLGGITLGSEVIPPVPVSDKSVEVKKFTVKKKENGDKYFFCLQAQSEIGIVHSTSGIITKKNDADPEIVLNEIRKYGATTYKCPEDRVVVTAFNRID